MELHLKIAYEPTASDQLSWWQEIAASANWWMPYENICFVSERPIRCSIDENRVLHHESQAAMEFRDGWKVWAWHGVRVPESVIKAPETLTIQQIVAEENAEVRRVMVERMGWERFVAESEMRVVHTDRLRSRFPVLEPSSLVDNDNPLAFEYAEGIETAELLESTLMRDFEDRPLKFVRLTCPSTNHVYVQRVAHDETRVYAAVARSFRKTEEQYKSGKYIRQGDVLIWWLDQADERLVQAHS